VQKSCRADLKDIGKSEEESGMKIGALEAGGTKMVCAVGNEKGEILDQISLSTLTPKETMPGIIDYFHKAGIEALGVGSFGPVDLNKKSDTYGYITSTPKLAWRNYNLLGELKKELFVPMGFDTDVNASMLGEVTWGNARGLDSAIYITIGTGVGVGIISNGALLHGMLHPEAGHILLAREAHDSYKGKCPYHGTCLEGLAAGPAIEERWGKSGKDLAGIQQVWELEAFYIAQALVNYTLIVSPQRIILGGGVMKQEQLFLLIRQKYKELMNSYIVTRETENLDEYIVPAGLDGNQGIMGCIALALQEI